VNQKIQTNNFHEPFIKISDKKIDVNRDLIFYTWSSKKNIPVDCDIVFDLSDIIIPHNNSTGLDERIQKTIQYHSAYNDIIKGILKYIELNEYKKIGFVCVYGKVVSVGFAELLKKIYYQRTIIYHNNLKV
tara:strand:- start:895 stop:1287 length:393 start_codon:yes stop_codon:yes gene_type:complete